MLSAAAMIKQEAYNLSLKMVTLMTPAIVQNSCIFQYLQKYLLCNLVGILMKTYRKVRSASPLSSILEGKKPSLVKYKLQSSLPLRSASSHHHKPKLSSVLHLFIYFYV